MASEKPKTKNETSGNPFTITRTFEAPRELLFDVWTDPKHLIHWIGPKGVVGEFIKADIRAGGTSFCCMTVPGGSNMYSKAIYREVSRSTRIVYTQYFCDQNQEIVRHPLSPIWPLEILTTVHFEEVGSQTKLTLIWTALNASAEEQATFDQSHESMNQGWGGSFEQLAAYLGDL